MNKPVTKSNFLTQLKNEDWIATFMGAILVLLVIFVPSLGKVKYQFPEGYPLWFAKVPFEKFLGQTIYNSPMNMTITGDRGMAKTSILNKRLVYSKYYSG